jgi:hypothetical protein
MSFWHFKCVKYTNTPWIWIVFFFPGSHGSNELVTALGLRSDVLIQKCPDYRGSIELKWPILDLSLVEVYWQVSVMGGYTACNTNILAQFKQEICAHNLISTFLRVLECAGRVSLFISCVLNWLCPRRRGGLCPSHKIMSFMQDKREIFPSGSAKQEMTSLLNIWILITRLTLEMNDNEM